MTRPTRTTEQGCRHGYTECDLCDSEREVERLELLLADRDAEIERLRGALQTIADVLPCDRPCSPPSRCATCGMERGGICTGCIARAALSQPATPPEGPPRPSPWCSTCGEGVYRTAGSALCLDCVEWHEEHGWGAPAQPDADEEPNDG